MADARFYGSPRFSVNAAFVISVYSDAIVFLFGFVEMSLDFVLICWFFCNK